MVSHADLRVSRMVGRTDRWCRVLFCADSICRARRPVAAAGRVVLCLDSFLQCNWTYGGYDPGAYGPAGDIRASRSRILFVASSFHRICLVDDKPDQDGSWIAACGFRCWAAGFSLAFFRAACWPQRRSPAPSALQAIGDSSPLRLRNDKHISAVLPASAESGKIPTP